MKDDSGSSVLFPEQGSSASQMKGHVQDKQPIQFQLIHKSKSRTLQHSWNFQVRRKKYRIGKVFSFIEKELFSTGFRG